MKEFERWNKDYPDNIAVFYINRKEGWRAALEWVMKQHCLYYSSYTFKVIEKELENE